MTDANPTPDPYQSESSSFDGARTRPEQTEEQIAKIYDVAEYMRDVIDPELGINIVDLGLVYDMWFEELEGKNTVVINMTLTSPACPLTDVIAEQIEDAIIGNKQAEAVDLNWVWMPPWGPNMITEEGREQLQALGFSV
ncbi:MAG: metal-sulfur cluster assembly factor [Corynebacterium casei]|uniref:metal-sulfur cluster assembly factor n=1 Tax=Corynebacterium TaxID=1716 RepID=UPI002649BFD3|nr:MULTISPECIES: metal-sulfur cluster assembly factor [Corynebacterium]MDN6487260.1 metal-sulfur cluster assembly factor [Ancrocorticia sp.]MDN5707376.1 metal-sulfur cluster assembly factor [Corynebacterium casei]MDN5884612.1 metal-sulfur cluster assembly factor [Corynebacterium casei]MDN5903425.1 metal-sulfur cluster assembly factor [Corynebacterium casei]MDN6136396.1 metal-sulfur cluster assembly factor [Corynebacterium sp.]